jgi:hypothetical protein
MEPLDHTFLSWFTTARLAASPLADCDQDEEE